MSGYSCGGFSAAAMQQQRDSCAFSASCASGGRQQPVHSLSRLNDNAALTNGRHSQTIQHALSFINRVEKTDL
jgi:hypothetical protein